MFFDIICNLIHDILGGELVISCNEENSINLGNIYIHTIEPAKFHDMDESEKNIFRDKFVFFKEQGIQRVTLFDVDYYNNEKKIKMYFQDLLLPKRVIFARKCELREIKNRKEADDFLNKYHLQGRSVSGVIAYGLYYQNELMSVMTFGHMRMHKKDGIHFELHRYAVKTGITIIGGANRLFKHFVQDYNPKYIRTYSQNDLYTGSIYPLLGFKYKEQAATAYFWYLSGNELKRESCQVKKLKIKHPDLYKFAIENKLPQEKYIMRNLGAKRIFRSGNTIWEWTLGNN